MNIYYDLSYFLKPANESESAEISEKIKEEIKKRKGEILEESQPRRTHLSYPINKLREGYLNSVKFISEPSVINLINSSLKSNPGVLRFFIKKIVKKEGREFSTKKKPSSPFARKGKPQKKEPQTETQIAEIDKKIEELLGN